MRRITALAAITLLLAAPARSQETTDYSALWTEVSAAHPLPYGLSVDGGIGFRTIDALHQANRFDANIGIDRKLGKHAKVALTYTFIMRHYLEQTEYKYKGDHDYSSYQGTAVELADADGDLHTYRYQGYNLDAAYWVPRHRIALDVAFDKRYHKLLRVSLRERYQFTHQRARHIDRTRFREPAYDADGNLTAYDAIAYTQKDKHAWDRHLLRSRLKFAIDKKRWLWEPFLSVELHNDIAHSFHLDKVRLAAGTEYAITKQHRLSLAYVFTTENDDDGDERIHALSLGYRFKF